jgi:hypothetical protein
MQLLCVEDNAYTHSGSCLAGCRTRSSRRLRAGEGPARSSRAPPPLCRALRRLLAATSHHVRPHMLIYRYKGHVIIKVSAVLKMDAVCDVCRVVGRAAVKPLFGSKAQVQARPAAAERALGRHCTAMSR